MFTGGGAGMAPMIAYLRLFAGYSDRRSLLLYAFIEGSVLRRGWRIQRESGFPHWAPSEPARRPLTGATGFIHQVLLRDYLSKHPSPEDVEYYLVDRP
jgi:Na+-transporting NADH:ubiquinone oxidoreductase subunit F